MPATKKTSAPKASSATKKAPAAKKAVAAKKGGVSKAKATAAAPSVKAAAKTVAKARGINQLMSFTHEERLANLQKAHATRAARAGIKNNIRAGKFTIKNVVTRHSGDKNYEGLRVRDVIKCIHGIGPEKCKSAMEQLQIAQNRRVGGMTPDQRLRLVGWVEARGNQ